MTTSLRWTSLACRDPFRQKAVVDGVLANELSRFLSQSKAEQRGIVTEVFVMDNRGLNVGQSDVTSDYWQGDEAKWQQTFLVGPGAVMIDDVELDESTQTFQSQLNMTITDETTGEVIGAITVGIDVEAIFWADIETASRWPTFRCRSRVTGRRRWPRTRTLGVRTCALDGSEHYIRPGYWQPFLRWRAFLNRPKPTAPAPSPWPAVNGC